LAQAAEFNPRVRSVGLDGQALNPTASLLGSIPGTAFLNPFRGAAAVDAEAKARLRNNSPGIGYIQTHVLSMEIAELAKRGEIDEVLNVLSRFIWEHVDVPKSAAGATQEEIDAHLNTQLTEEEQYALLQKYGGVPNVAFVAGLIDGYQERQPEGNYIAAVPKGSERCLRDAMEMFRAEQAKVAAGAPSNPSPGQQCYDWALEITRNTTILPANNDNPGLPK
jgi:hypothetical protein